MRTLTRKDVLLATHRAERALVEVFEPNVACGLSFEQANALELALLAVQKARHMLTAPEAAKAVHG